MTELNAIWLLVIVLPPITTIFVLGRKQIEQRIKQEMVEKVHRLNYKLGGIVQK